MPLFFLGTREWRNRQTRTVQVRVPVMEWGFNSPLAHDETADPSGSAVFVFPGCGLWPRWCSARRRARPPARLGVLSSFGAAPRSSATPRHRLSISHVIPLRLVQTLNLHRWNCNVFGVSRKMTVGNYVRNLGGGGVVAARGHRSRALSARWAGCLKPPSPLRVQAEPRLKPSSPLRVRNGCFWCSFWVQR